MNPSIKVAQLLAMATAMDNVAGPMSFITGRRPARIKKDDNKYAGMQRFSGAKEIARRARRLAEAKSQL